MASDLPGLVDQAGVVLEGSPWLGLRAVSHVLGVERHTVERAFQLNTGRSFRAFRRDLLLQRAKDLLGSGPTSPIKEITFLLGYKSERAFARFIRSMVGCCPCELRRHLRAVGQPSTEVPDQAKHSSAAQMPQARRSVRTAA